MSLFETVSKGIMEAMKAKDKIRVETLRGIKKEFLEANTSLGAGQILSDEAGILIIQKMAKQRNDSATIYKEQGREDLAEKELAELIVLHDYLPKQLTQEELDAEVTKIIEQTGAKSPADMGKVMGLASKQLAGVAAGKAVADTVKRLLTK